VNRLILEVCVDNYPDAADAAKAGADRLELCGALCVGGITPRVELYRAIRDDVRIPIAVMIRTHAAGFEFDAADVKEQRRSIAEFHPHRPAAFVFGALTRERTLDLSVLAELKASCGDTPVVMHRAFDAVRDQFLALDQLVELGFQRVLTSGNAATAPEGAVRLTELIQRANGRITVLPGGGIRLQHLDDLHRQTGFREVHGSFRKNVAAVRRWLDHSAKRSGL